MKILGIHHIAIICSHYPTSKHFYSEILGFKIINEEYRSERKSYKLDLLLPDNSQIELFSFANPPARPSYPEAQGLRHLALGVENLEQCLDHLHSKQIATEPIRVDPSSQKRFVFFNDPDQLPIELYEI